VDPYFYPGTDVLRNKLGIRDNEDLRAAETRIGLFALERLKTRPLVLPFTVERLKATHEAIFRDIYEWAGQLRKNTGTMTKGRVAGYTITYGNSDFVPQELDRIFENLRRDNYLRGLAPQRLRRKNRLALRTDRRNSPLQGRQQSRPPPGHRRFGEPGWVQSGLDHGLCHRTKAPSHLSRP
jgi:cell filamentation protein